MLSGQWIVKMEIESVSNLVAHLIRINLREKVDENQLEGIRHDLIKALTPITGRWEWSFLGECRLLTKVCQDNGLCCNDIRTLKYRLEHVKIVIDVGFASLRVGNTYTSLFNKAYNQQPWKPTKMEEYPELVDAVHILRQHNFLVQPGANHEMKLYFLE